MKVKRNGDKDLWHSHGLQHCYCLRLSRSINEPDGTPNKAETQHFLRPVEALNESFQLRGAASLNMKVHTVCLLDAKI